MDMMKAVQVLLLFSIALMVAGCQSSNGTEVLPMNNGDTTQREGDIISLPEPWYQNDFSVERSLLERRSTRSYTNEPLKLDEVSQLLWAAQGITNTSGYRTAPSAGALYPLEVYIVVGNVEDLAPGVYHYLPENHELELIVKGDVRDKLADAALSQSSVREGAVSIIITAIYERTTGKYGERGIRYVHIEVGHAAQNICLQATAMGLGLVTVGAFNDGEVAGLLGLAEEEEPLYIIPAGRKI
jgi:SagB-type dehydrogenase family enzyme